MTTPEARTSPLLTPPLKLLLFVDLLIVGGMFVFAALTADGLPDRYPVHFNAAGVPDRWATKGGIGWYTFPLFAVGLNALFVGIGLVLPKIPIAYWNLPHKELIEKLPPAALRTVVRAVLGMMLLLACFTALFLFGLFVATYRTAHGAPFPSALITVPVLAGVLSIVIGGTIVVSRRVKQAAADASR